MGDAAGVSAEEDEDGDLDPVVAAALMSGKAPVHLWKGTLGRSKGSYRYQYDKEHGRLAVCHVKAKIVQEEGEWGPYDVSEEPPLPAGMKRCTNWSNGHWCGTFGGIHEEDENTCKPCQNFERADRSKAKRKDGACYSHMPCCLAVGAAVHPLTAPHTPLSYPLLFFSPAAGGLCPVSPATSSHPSPT